MVLPNDFPCFDFVYCVIVHCVIVNTLAKVVECMAIDLFVCRIGGSYVLNYVNKIAYSIEIEIAQGVE